MQEPCIQSAWDGGAGVSREFWDTVWSSSAAFGESCGYQPLSGDLLPCSQLAVPWSYHFRKTAESVKDVYGYPLDEHFRMKMGIPEGSGLGEIEITAGIEGGNWAEKEFGGSTFGR